MVTEIADLCISFHKILVHRAKERLNGLDEILKKELDLNEFNKTIIFPLDGLGSKFSFPDLQDEIRKNMLKFQNEMEIFNYFFYLVKIYQELRNEITSAEIYSTHFYKIAEDIEDGVFEPDAKIYSSISQLAYHIKKMLFKVQVAGIDFYAILKKEFSFNSQQWLNFIVTNDELPSLFDIKNHFFSKSPNEILQETESLENAPLTSRIKWKGTPAQLAYVINLLQTKGWIEGLTGKGEKDAKIILTHFEIDGHSPTPESLGKCFQQMKKDELPINKEDAAKFLKFPHRNDLKR